MSSKVFFCLQINSDSFIISNTAKNVTIISNLLSNFLIRLDKEMIFLLLKLETIKLIENSFKSEMEELGYL